MALLRNSKGRLASLSAGCLPVSSAGPSPVCARLCLPSSVPTSVSVQGEYQKKLEQTVEQMKEEEMMAMKKQQELTARLSWDGFVGGSLHAGRDRASFQGTERLKKAEENSVYHWTSNKMSQKDREFVIYKTFRRGGRFYGVMNGKGIFKGLHDRLSSIEP